MRGLIGRVMLLVFFGVALVGIAVVMLADVCGAMTVEKSPQNL
jgi:hypothetical protein